MMTTNSSAQEIATAITQGKAVQDAINLDVLAEVDRILSSKIDNSRMKPLVVIYGIEGRNAAVTYPLISKTRLSITSEILLERKNFTLILHQPEVIGNVLSSSFKGRIREDWKTLGLALVVFLITLPMLAAFSHPASARYIDYLSDPDTAPLVQNVINFYEVIGQALLTIMTLFLTVFVLFTISQNADISKDTNLYTRGLFHKFIRDDLYITKASAVSLLASALGLLFTLAPSEFYSFTVQGTEFNKLNSLIPFLYAIAVASFVVSLTSLNYYAKRIVTANESNLMKQILDEREEVAKQYRQQLEQNQNKPVDTKQNGQ